MKVRFIIAIALLLFSTWAHSSPTSGLVATKDESEQKLFAIILNIEKGDIKTAEIELKRLVAKQPNFRLAHLVYGDLMLSRAKAIGSIGGDLAQNPDVVSLKEEIKRRITHLRNEAMHTRNVIPDSLLKVSASQKQIVVIDAGESRAYVFRNDRSGPTLVDDYFVTVGKNGVVKTVEGDGRTPIGVYFITSRLDPLGLDDLYGDGALALNYPNELDQLLGRTGYGIWLHGVPNSTYNRPPYATEGCIALVNTNIVDLYNTPDIQNTPVIITQSANWVPAEDTAALKETVLGRIEDWRVALENQDLNRYLEFYSSSFSKETLGYAGWIEYKKMRAEISGIDSLALSDTSLFQYPGDQKIVVATFDQNYGSLVGGRISRIRQYWRLEEGDTWQILYEGIGEYKPIHYKGIPEDALPVIANM